ncbi:hypothetical protein AVEN_153087-1 [Araneus ventricosus]|uniref:Uncharacterized protein n=1 Tax=Araneus ventricosus TaxID=182803 RepID=A0A4Y2E333_ARAVE|nr:hypothetical protein AVEN_153087-1 [Araneus ventricosus]
MRTTPELAPHLQTATQMRRNLALCGAFNTDDAVIHDGSSIESSRTGDPAVSKPRLRQDTTLALLTTELSNLPIGFLYLSSFAATNLSITHMGKQQEMN